MAQGHSIDEYLETIYFLAFPIGEYRPATGSTAIASRVAEMLGVSRASAGEMLKRLEAEGLVERGEQKEALLDPGHHVVAERVAELVGVDVRLGGRVAHEVREEPLDDAVLAHDALGGSERAISERAADGIYVRGLSQP